MLRFGKCLDVLYTALPLLRYNDAKIRVTVALSKITSALFLLTDHILWLGRADLCNVNTEKWSNISNKYWLYSITMNLMRDFYEITNVLKARLKSNDIISDKNRAFTSLIQCLYNNQKITIDTVKNACDLFIPLTALGYVKLKPSTVGLLGVISSIAGILVLTDPQFKLTPS